MDKTLKVQPLLSFAEKYGCPRNDLLECLKVTLNDMIDDALDVSPKTSNAPQIDVCAPPAVPKKESSSYLSLMEKLTNDDILCAGKDVLPSFEKLSVHVLMKVCKKLGVKKYTTMKKDEMVKTLFIYKQRYNNEEVFRFHVLFVQQQCNKPQCERSVDLQEHEGCKWRYCSKHNQLKTSMLLSYDSKLCTSFLDTENDVVIPLEESIERFENMFIRNTAKNNTVNGNGTENINRELPFSGALTNVSTKLIQTKPVKNKSSNVRQNLMSRMKNCNMMTARCQMTKMNDKDVTYSNSPTRPLSPLISSHDDITSTALENDEDIYIDDSVREDEIGEEDEEDIEVDDEDCEEEDEEEDEEEEEEEAENENNDEEDMDMDVTVDDDEREDGEIVVLLKRKNSSGLIPNKSKNKKSK